MARYLLASHSSAEAAQIEREHRAIHRANACMNAAPWLQRELWAFAA